MPDNQGWIKLHRKLLTWEWYTDSKTFHLFLHLVLRANHETKSWKGQEVKRGQLITGLHSLSSETGISIQSLRTSLNRLKSTNELTIKTSNKNSLITILKYDLYQEKEEANKQTNKPVTNKQQTTNKQLTTNKNVKNLKNDKKDIPTAQEFLAYALEKKPTLDHESVKLKYESWKVNDWTTGKDKPIKNWRSTLLNTIPHLKENNSKPQNSIF